MVKRNKFLNQGILCFFAFLLLACSSDEPNRQTFPLSADIFHSVSGRQVAFQGLTHSATTWFWDFGDGNTSTEQNPVHEYEAGGYYTAVLMATDKGGNTIEKEVNLAVDLTPYILLTGGPTALEGKTWKLTASHAPADKLANADASLSAIEQPLPTGAFDLLLGMGEVYQDEFTFHFDGGYGVDPKEDNAVFSGLVYQLLTTGGAGVVNAGGQDFGLCTGLYAPEADITFSFNESKDFMVPSPYGPGGVITFEDVMTLDFTGNGFVGFYDFQREVMVEEITDSTMRIVMFMAAAPEYLPLNTHALVLTFEVVR